MSTIRVILADDHQILRQGVQVLLDRDDRFEVVGEAADGLDAVRLATEHRPDVLVTDLRMPGLNGIEVTRRVLAACPATRVVGLTAHADAMLAVDLLRAGASGCVLKDAAIAELIAAISTALEGGVFVSPFLSSIVMADIGRPSGGPPAGPALSPRERQVLQLVADGRSTKQVAYEMGVSVKTIETHRRNLMEKLQIDNVAGLTKHAIRSGLCEL